MPLEVRRWWIEQMQKESQERAEQFQNRGMKTVDVK
jgi:hypothetical protein